MFFSHLNKQPRLAGRADAYRRLVQLAIAVARYQAEKQKSPDSLADLVPAYIAAIPLDPFSGQPLRLATHPGGVTLYSLGPSYGPDAGQPVDGSPHPPAAGLTLRVGGTIRAATP